jgi:hypothetical protein
MNAEGRVLTRVLFLLLLMVVPPGALAHQPEPPVYVVLWFDTEDYILPASDDAALKVADWLHKEGIRATFKVVGEKARTLEKRGRTDVIEALKKHEIGYHSNTHSQQPTVAVYLQNAGWESGSAEFYRREMAGVKDIQRIFGVTPSCYGQPGSSWAPQAYPALRRMGIRMYLDEADHVGIDDQPFYYARLLNVFKMRSMLARMELSGGNSLGEGKARFTGAYDKLRAQGGGTISIYYHPSEWVHAEFWDGVNFSHGAHADHARSIAAVRGAVRFRLECQPAFDYARLPHQITLEGRGAVFEAPGMRVSLISRFPLARQGTGVATEFLLHPGEPTTFVLRQVEGDGVAARVLKNLAVDIEKTRLEILRELDPNFAGTAKDTKVFEMLQNTGLPKPELDSVDTSKRYDVYCSERNQEVVVYRNALFKRRSTLLSTHQLDFGAEFLELEQANGQTVYLSLLSVLRFCEHGAEIVGEIIPPK